MKKFLNIFFVALGIIFFGILIVGALFFILDPYQIRPMLTEITTGSETTETNTETSVTDKNPALSDSQEKALEKFGIDPATIPSSITAEQEACFVSKLGEARVAEIKAGDSPTATEYFKAKDCI